MRLTIQNVAAPDLSGTSRILANAAQSLDRGLESASGLLDKYNQGQQETADASILSKIAGLSSEEELASFLGSGELEKLNLSKEMRETVLGLRSDILKDGQARATIGQTEANTKLTNADIGLTTANTDRARAQTGLIGAQTGQVNANTGLISANTDSVRASTAITQAAEGRTVTKFDDQIAQRDARRALTPAVVNANIEGNELGKAQPVNASSLLQDFEGFDNNSYFDVNAERIGFGSDTITLADGTVRRVQKGDTVSRADAERDLARRIAGFENDIVQRIGGDAWNNLPQNAKAALTSIVYNYGDDPKDLGAIYDAARRGDIEGIAKGIEARGQDNDGINANRRAKEAAIVRGNSSANRPAFNDLKTAIKDSLLFEPADAEILLSNARKAQASGQARINANNAKIQKEVSAAAILDSVQDPTNINNQNVTSDLINDPNIGTANERIEAITRANALTGEGGPLRSTLRPSVPVNETIRNSVELFEQGEQNQINFSAQKRILDRVPNFQQDPAGALIEEFDLLNQGVFTSLTKEELTKEINKIADETGVTPAIVAASLAENRDVDYLPGNDVNDNFALDATRKFIKANLSEEALSRFNERRVTSESRQREVSSLQLQLSGLRSQAAKFGPNVPPALVQNIQSLESQILNATNGSSVNPVPNPIAQSATQQLSNVPASQTLQVNQNQFNQEQLRNYVQSSGFSDQFRVTQPGSPERQQVIRVFIQSIQNDARLSEGEKLNLINAIEGNT